MVRRSQNTKTEGAPQSKRKTAKLTKLGIRTNCGKSKQPMEKVESIMVWNLEKTTKKVGYALKNGKILVKFPKRGGGHPIPNLKFSLHSPIEEAKNIGKIWVQSPVRGRGSTIWQFPPNCPSSFLLLRAFLPRIPPQPKVVLGSDLVRFPFPILAVSLLSAKLTDIHLTPF